MHARKTPIYQGLKRSATLQKHQGRAPPTHAFRKSSKTGVFSIPKDLSDPDDPQFGTPVPTVGGAQDLAVTDDYAYVATGATGIEVFSLADPGNPVSSARCSPS